MPDDLTLQRIRFAQVETATYCNYKCPYCQIAHFTRDVARMSLDRFYRVADSLTLLPSLEEVYLNGYNEPSLVPDIVAQAERLAALPARLILLSNGFGLTTERARALISAHPRITFDLHLSAVDPSEYHRLHGITLRPELLDRLLALGRDEEFARADVRLMVMGTGDDAHHRNYEEVSAFFYDTRFVVNFDLVHDRAGAIPAPYAQNHRNETVRGCSLRNRHLDWIHISANGNWILCCQDFHEDYVFGNVFERSLEDIAASEKRRAVVAMITGRAPATSELICRTCKYAEV